VSLAPLDLVAAHPWQNVTFTTYALSLSFFESVVLDGLIRGGSSSALILADAEGVRGSLGEQGAQRVGKDYEVEPVVVTGGVFHAKITAFTSTDECHLLVGSGNLTFGGWGGNCEVLEHLHPEFAADAILDAAEFFDLLRDTPRVRQRAEAQCAQVANQLRRAAEGKAKRGDVRLLHNLRESISDQIVRAAGELGGATRLVAAAPFWDKGAAVDTLAGSLGLQEVFVHAHPFGVVEGLPGSDWPRQARTRIAAVSVAPLEAEGRRLHAKVFEVLCRRGRLVISGSANGSTAAINAGHNVEACVMRVQRESVVGWTYRMTEVPDGRVAEEDAGTEDEVRCGVLRAVLEGDELVGEVMTPRMTGSASLFSLTTAGAEPLGDVVLAADGAFRAKVQGLEERTWRAGRLVVRVAHPDGRRAEGFVSVAMAASVSRRAGLIGRRLQALLAGTETPADVAAIMSWFHDDPSRLSVGVPAAAGRAGAGGKSDQDRLIPVAALGEGYAHAPSGVSHVGAQADGGWQRFMHYVLAAFRERRPSHGTTGAGAARQDGRDEGEGMEADDVDDDVGPGSVNASNDQRAVAQSLKSFRGLFAILTRPDAPVLQLITALDLTLYVCHRLHPDERDVHDWLRILIDRLSEVSVPAERREDITAAALAIVAFTPGREVFRWARRRLLKLDVDLASECPALEGADGFARALPSQMLMQDVWSGLRGIRTFEEQVRAYLSALENQTPSDGYPDLPAAVPTEWRVLRDAFTANGSRRRIIVTGRANGACPDCNTVMPNSERLKLQSTGIATAANCCGRVVIEAED
jgi:hypothetical protein